MYALKEAAQIRLSLHMSKCHIVGNHMSWLIYVTLVAKNKCVDETALIKSMHDLCFLFLDIQ